jgi:hypothetical protein
MIAGSASRQVTTAGSLGASAGAGGILWKKKPPEGVMPRAEEWPGGIRPFIALLLSLYCPHGLSG